MAGWPDAEEAVDAIGVVNDDETTESEIDACLAAAIDFLTHRCYIEDDTDVPAAVRRACVMLTARLFRRRQSVEGVAGFGDFGAVRVSSVDVDIENLIAPYRNWGVA